MRLHERVIETSPQVTNPLGEREMDLRGKGLTSLDEATLNLIAEHFDCVNLADNKLTVLGPLPKSSRLSTVIAHRNAIKRLDGASLERLSSLHTLVADGNQIALIADLIPLSRCRATLERVSFARNPVASIDIYRSALQVLCPRLKLINYQRVTAKDKEKLKQDLPAVMQAIGSATGGVDSAEGGQRIRKRTQQGKSMRRDAAPTGAIHGRQLSQDDINAQLDAIRLKLEQAETEEEVLELQAQMDLFEEAATRFDKKRRIEQ